MKTTKFLLTLLLLLIISIHAHANDCYKASIMRPSPFLGNDGEIFELNDGTLWEVKYEYEYLYEYYPDVIICPGRGLLIINDSKLNVVQLK